MTVTIATTTLQPGALATGAAIIAADAIEVVEMLNYAAARTPQGLLNLVFAGAGWGDSTNELPAFSARFASSSGSSEVAVAYVYIDPDCVEVRVGAKCTFTGADEGEVEIAIGATSSTLSFAAADAGSFAADLSAAKTALLATADIGATGWVKVTISFDHTVGSLSTNTLDWVGVWEEPQDASDLSAPVAE